MLGVNYPQREKFFSQRFHRLMAKVVLAQDIGPMGYTILSVIASQEDSCRYRKAVTYYDSQLMPLVGCKSCSQFVKIRRKLVADGWLNFTPGKKGTPSAYWVTIPTVYDEVEDSGTGETERDLSAGFAPPAELMRSGSGADEEQIRSRRGADEEPKESIPYPIPLNPIPSSLGPVREEIQKQTLEQVAAAMATEFHFSIPGSSRPLLPDLRENFLAKLTWLKANGRDETELIWRKIRDPTRDKTKVFTVNQMFKFWQYCGLEESDERSGNGKKAIGQTVKRAVPGGDAWGDAKRYDGSRVKTVRYGDGNHGVPGPEEPVIQPSQPAGKVH